MTKDFVGEHSITTELKKQNIELKNRLERIDRHVCQTVDTPTSVATQEKPGPLKEGGRMIEERESSRLDSTGAVKADSEGESSTTQGKPQRRKKEKRQKMRVDEIYTSGDSSSTESDTNASNTNAERSRYDQYKKSDRKYEEMKEIESKCDRKIKEQEQAHKTQIEKLKREFEEKFKGLTNTKPKEVLVVSEAEEPSSTSREVETQKRVDENSQKRESNIPECLVVLVTEENKHLVSKKDNGMLLAPDGSLQRTPQYNTWNENRHLQLRNDTETAPNIPAHIDLETPGHPLPAKVTQAWSHGGEWVKVPINPKDKEAWMNNWRAGRIEPIIDINGKLVKILSYGEGAGELTVWFWLEEVLEYFPEWVIPAPPLFFNNKKLNMMTLRDASTYKGNQGNQTV